MWWRVRRRTFSSAPSRTRRDRSSGPRVRSKGRAASAAASRSSFRPPRRRRQAVQLDARQRHRHRRRHHLHRPAREYGERRAQGLVAGRDLGEAGGERPGVEPPAAGEGAGDVVRRAPRLELVEEPEPLLGMGERHRAVVGPARDGVGRQGPRLETAGQDRPAHRHASTPRHGLLRPRRHPLVARLFHRRSRFLYNALRCVRQQRRAPSVRPFLPSGRRGSNRDKGGLQSAGRMPAPSRPQTMLSTASATGTSSSARSRFSTVAASPSRVGLWNRVRNGRVTSSIR